MIVEAIPRRVLKRRERVVVVHVARRSGTGVKGATERWRSRTVTYGEKSTRSYDDSCRTLRDYVFIESGGQGGHCNWSRRGSSRPRATKTTERPGGSCRKATRAEINRVDRGRSVSQPSATRSNVDNLQRSAILHPHTPPNERIGGAHIKFVRLFLRMSRV